MAIKVNDENHIEYVNIQLSRDKTPIAFKNKLEDLMEKGFETEEAIEYIESVPIKMELYYEKGHGLIMVESDELDCNLDICSPYTKEPFEQIENECDKLLNKKYKNYIKLLSQNNKRLCQQEQ